MTHATRRPLLVIAALAAMVLVAAACGPSTSSATPSSSASRSIAPTPPSATPAPSATALPTATPAPTPAPSTACVVTPETGALPSDRFTNLRVSSTETADRLTFVFGNPSLPGPAGPPEGSLAVAEPPYTEGASGAAIEMTGQRVLQVRFSGMSLSNDVGQETYTGPIEIKPDLLALRHAVMYDASEGIVGWYVGYDGGGCVTLEREGNDVTVRIDYS